MREKQQVTSGGVGTVGATTLVFVVLKLVGVIDWSWVWVLSPLWIAPSLFVAVVVLTVVIGWIVLRATERR